MVSVESNSPVKTGVTGFFSPSADKDNCSEGEDQDEGRRDTKVIN